MKTVIDTERVPIKLWLDDIEAGALTQAKNLANLPFTFKWIPIMPDSHQGYGMPIGGVLPTEEVIIPNAVGVDIGCGMCAVKTSLKEITTQQLKQIMGLIRERVPLGFNHHEKKQEILMPDMKHTTMLHGLLEGGLKQVGTLGGGNHFIEIQKGNDGFVWIMIHSGSRAVGYKTANFYAKRAKELNEKYRSEVPPKWDLAFLPLDSEEGKNYMNDMQYCTQFAYLNRRLMLNRIQDSFIDIVKDIDFETEINIPHNYATWEHHFNKNVMVHRKGATSAKEGEVGIIPGSQGSKSYIVQGKGNNESFMSCSHGAGRKMGRTFARKTLNLKEEIEKLDAMGVVHSIRNTSDLDEAPSAYKDIDVVMSNQTDLVDILVELTPLAVIKSSDGSVD